MITQSKWITLLGFSLCASWALQEAHAQLRTDSIESARTEKEANLTPETPPRAERDIGKIENSWPYRLFTGQLDGFGIGFGTIVPGSSVAIGPRYLRRLWDGKLILRVEARGSVNES